MEPTTTTTMQKALMGVGLVIVGALIGSAITYNTNRAGNPDARGEAAVDAAVGDMDQWIVDYKAANPGATDAEAEAAFETEIWKG